MTEFLGVFTSIFEGIGTLISMISSVITGILDYLVLMGSAIAFSFTAITHLPAFLLPFATVGILLPVVLLIIDR